MPAERFDDLISAVMCLQELKARAALFEDFVKGEKYSITREKCAHYFGFELPEENDDRAD